MSKPVFPQTGYKKFREEMIEKLNKDLPFEQTGKMWDALTKEEKDFYEKPFLEEVKEYDEDVKAYRQANPSKIQLAKKAKYEQSKANPMNGYVKFSFDVRDRQKDVNLQQISEQWSALTDDERKEYNDSVKAIKDAEKAKEKEKIERLKKKLGIVDEPKKPAIAMNRYRNFIKESGKVLKGKEFNEMWADLSEEDRKPYQDEYEAENEVYKTVHAEWKEKHGPKDESKPESKEKDPNMPKKPLSGYMRFGAKQRSETEATITFKDIATKWEKLPEEEKEIFNKQYHDELEGYKIALNEYYEKKAEEEEEEQAEKSKDKRKKRLPIKQQREMNDEDSMERPKKSVTSKYYSESGKSSVSMHDQKKEDYINSSQDLKNSSKSKKITKS